jgi:tyrosyl-tRNA synthetase
MKKILVSKELRDATGVDLASVLVDAQFAKSKNEARRLIQNSGIRLQNFLVEDPFAHLAWSEDTGWILLETIT